MKKHLKKWILAAVAPVLAVGFANSSAHAGTLNIYLQEVGVDATPVLVSTLVGGFGSTIFDGTHGDFDVTVLSASSHNKVTKSDLLSSTNSILNNTNDTHTLLIYATETDYTLPNGTPLNVESGLGGSVNSGSVGLTGIFQAYFDASDALSGMASTNGPQNATLNATTFDTGSAVGLFDRSGPYSLTSVTKLVLGGGAEVNFSDHINVTPVPLPSAAWGGLGLMGVLFVARRRAQA